MKARLVISVNLYGKNILGFSFQLEECRFLFLVCQAFQGRDVKNKTAAQRDGGDVPPPVPDEPEASSPQHPLAEGFPVGLVQVRLV